MVYYERRRIDETSFREPALTLKVLADCVWQHITRSVGVESVMKFSELKKHLEAGALCPAYFVAGADSYLSAAALRMFKGLTGETALSLDIFSPKALPDDILSSLQIMPFMSEHRVVVVKGSDFPAALVRELESYLDAPAPDAVLVVVLDGSEPPKDALQGLAAKCMRIDCEPLEQKTLQSFIRRECADKAKIGSEAVDLLVMYTGGMLSRISQELPKLCAFRDGGEITTDDIENFVTRDTEYKIYQLTDLLAQGKAEESMRVLKAMREETEDLKIIGSVYNHFRRLLHTAISKSSEGELAKALGIKPTALKFTRRQAALYKPVRLKGLVDYIADTDFRIKSGAIAANLGLDNIVLKILGV